jgi:hypothetical protein
MYKELISWRKAGASRHQNCIRISSGLKLKLDSVRNNIGALFVDIDGPLKEQIGGDLHDPLRHLEERKKMSFCVAKASAKEIVLMWLNYQLKKAKRPPVLNFGKDLKDGTALVHLVNRIGSRCASCKEACKDERAMERLTNHTRADLVIKAAIQLLPNTAVITITSTHIVTESIEPILEFIIQLMMFSPSLSVDVSDVCHVHLKKAVLDLDNSMMQLDNLIGDYKHLGSTDCVIDGRAARVVEKIQQRWTENGLAMEHCYVYMAHIAEDWQSISFKMLNKLGRLQVVMQQRREAELRGDDVSLVGQDLDISSQDLFQLDVQRVDDLFEADDPAEYRAMELQKSEMLLLSIADDMELIFKYYSDVGGPGMEDENDQQVTVGLSFRQWLLFVTEIGMLKPLSESIDSDGKTAVERDRIQMSKSGAEHIYLQSQSDRKENGSSKDDVYSSMTNRQFIESILRISKVHLIQGSMSAGLAHLITFFIKPYASKLDKTHFTALLSEQDMQLCMKQYTSVLRRLFAYYRTQDKSCPQSQSFKGNQKRINFMEICLMVDTFELITPMFSKQDLKRVFKQLQDDKDTDDIRESSDKPQKMGGLRFNEFVELVVTMACFKDPSPFDPLNLKLSSFIEKCIIASPSYASMPEYMET